MDGERKRLRVAAAEHKGEDTLMKGTYKAVEVSEPGRRGDTVNCQNPVTSGVSVDGGYAEVMIAEARGIASIPDALSSAEAAPLLCAGITTYNALRNAGLR